MLRRKNSHPRKKKRREGEGRRPNACLIRTTKTRDARSERLPLEGNYAYKYKKKWPGLPGHFN
jgi:hypothetical protein